MEPITIEALATTAGATVFAGIIVAFAGIFTNLTAYGKRVLAAVAGLGGVVGAVVLINPAVTVGLIVVAVIDGMLAGLAASKVFEVVTAGLNHKVEARPE